VYESVLFECLDGLEDGVPVSDSSETNESLYGRETLLRVVVGMPSKSKVDKCDGWLEALEIPLIDILMVNVQTGTLLQRPWLLYLSAIPREMSVDVLWHRSSQNTYRERILQD